MTISEFKAWLDGFEESIEGAPSPEQWAKIKSMLDQVGSVAGIEFVPVVLDVPASPTQPILRDPITSDPFPWPYKTWCELPTSTLGESFSIGES